MNHLLTTKDVMAYLNVPKSSIDYWVRTGEFSYYNYGKQRHFEKAEIDRWLRSKRKTNGKGALLEA